MAKRKHLLPKLGLFESSMLLFLVSIIVLILGFALTHYELFSQPILSVLFSLVYVLGLMAVGGRRGNLFRGAIVLVPALAARWCHEFYPQLASASLVAVLALLLLSYIVAQLLKFILLAPRVDQEILFAAVSTYLLLAIVWAFAYVLVEETSPGSFTVSSPAEQQYRLEFHSALYFSFITMTTVGYGDILPVTPVARTLAFSQAVVGAFYMAILIARLVAQYSSGKGLPVSSSEVD